MYLSAKQLSDFRSALQNLYTVKEFSPSLICYKLIAVSIDTMISGLSSKKDENEY
jgi:hypothetical protein